MTVTSQNSRTSLFKNPYMEFNKQKMDYKKCEELYELETNQLSLPSIRPFCAEIPPHELHPMQRRSQ